MQIQNNDTICVCLLDIQILGLFEIEQMFYNNRRTNVLILILRRTHICLIKVLIHCFFPKSG